ncbi:MAG: RNA methyltransferase [Dorea sp.]|nr:RNA methyltransferase [Dorea sp.]
MIHLIHVSEFDAPELDVYARFTEAQLLNKDHPEDGIFIAESPKVIERALNAGCRPLSLLVEEKHMDGEAKPVLERLKEASYGEIPVYTATFDVLSKITGFQLTRGALCAMRREALPSMEEICEGKRRVAVLENVMNPTNIGAIVRSAAAMHMEAILLTKGCSNPLYRRAIRVSMGTIFQIPWTFVEEGELSYVKRLQKMGFKTAAMALTEDSVSIDNEELMKEEKLAIILGNEGEGLVEQTLEESDYTVLIPMSHGVDSLNVAAASAVAFWQLR